MTARELRGALCIVAVLAMSVAVAYCGGGRRGASPQQAAGLAGSDSRQSTKGSASVTPFSRDSAYLAAKAAAEQAHRARKRRLDADTTASEPARVTRSGATVKAASAKSAPKIEKRRHGAADRHSPIESPVGQ